MTVKIEALQSTPLPKSTAHLLRGLSRHASAPAHPHLALDMSSTLDRHQQMSDQCSPTSPQSPGPSLRIDPNLINELSLAHSIISRLRLDRDKYRTATQAQTKQLIAQDHELARQKDEIAALKAQNTALQAQQITLQDENTALFAQDLILTSENATLQDENAALLTTAASHTKSHTKLQSRFRRAVTAHDALIDQLNDADRALAKLKRSDRAKGKVQQRNLRLKATLGRMAERSDEDALREALGRASERVGELEEVGGELLGKLEESGDGDGDEEGEGKAERRFKDVLEYKEFVGVREGWAELLGE